MKNLTPEALQQVAAYFQTLAEPTRLEAMRLLADGSVIGTVRDLLHGGNDLLEVELSASERRVYLRVREPSGAGRPADRLLAA